MRGPKPEANRGLDATRLWESTRPVEPSAAAWDEVWAGLTAQLDAKPYGVLPFKNVPRRRTWVRPVVAAQAAAVVAALVLGWVRFRPSETPHTVAQATPPAPSPIRRAEVEIGAGEVVILRDDGRSLRPVELALDDRSGVDHNFVMFNDVEAMAE